MQPAPLAPLPIPWPAPLPGPLPAPHLDPSLTICSPPWLAYHLVRPLLQCNGSCADANVDKCMLNMVSHTRGCTGRALLRDVVDYVAC